MSASRNGFLLVIGVTDSLPGSGDALETSVRRHLGQELQSLHTADLTVFAAGATALRKQDGMLRLAHGSAARSVASPAPYPEWRDAQEGSFAVLQADRHPGASHIAELRVARDRFGAVPVYIRCVGGGIAVSTSRRLLRTAFGAGEPDPLALLEATRFRWQSGRRTLDRDTSQLGPGEELVWKGPESPLQATQWARMSFVAEGPADLSVQSDRLRAALGDAVAAHLARSTRPAILLSGGVDSSVIAAVAREIRPDVRCYIGQVAGADGAEELRRSRNVARHLGLPLTEIPIDSGRFATDLLRVVDLLEEPPRNPNNLVLLQLYEAMQRDGVDLVLNGDGAEMLLGLADTARVARFVEKTRWVVPVPQAIRNGVARALRQFDRSAAWRLATVLDTPRADFAAALDELDHAPSVRRALRNWMANVAGDRGCPWGPLLHAPTDRRAFEDALHVFQCFTVLLSSQRRHECLARAVGIEAATPFTHRSVRQFAIELPRALRYTHRSRPVLKHLCDVLVHPDVANWPKLGFSVPWHTWLDRQLAAPLAEARSALSTSEILPGALRALVLTEESPEWRWTVLTLHLALRP
jgi:asparagine synthase (glutamine-hydrolysing)